MQVSRMTRVRNWSISAAVLSIRGAMQGAVGSASDGAGRDAAADVLARRRLTLRAPRRPRLA